MSFYYPESPRIFKTGDILTPDDLNHNYQYYVQLGNELKKKRYYHWSTTYQFGTINTSYTQASTSGLLSYYIPALDRRHPSDQTNITVYVDRIYVQATTVTGSVDVMLDTGTAAYTIGTLDSTTTSAFCGTQYALDGDGTPPRIYLSGTTFSVSGLIAQVHFKSDRYAQQEYPAPDIALVNDFDELDVNTINSNLQLLSDHLNEAISVNAAIRWTLVTFHNVSSATASYLRRADVYGDIAPLPKVAPAACQITGVIAYAECATGTSQTITFTFKNSGGTTIDTAVISMAGNTSGSQIKNFSTTDSLDNITVTVSGATNITKAYLYLLYA